MSKDTIDLSIIMDAVSKAFDMDQFTILNRCRKIHIVKARQWFHYFCRTLNPEQKITGEFIGKYYSDVTGIVYKHCTVLHSVKTVKGYIDVYPDDYKLKTDIIYSITKETTSHKEYKPPLVGNCAKCIFPTNIKTAA
jgi:chromosomal replication initiation ATPase DnaA